MTSVFLFYPSVLQYGYGIIEDCGKTFIDCIPFGIMILRNMLMSLAKESFMVSEKYCSQSLVTVIAILFLN